MSGQGEWWRKPPGWRPDPRISRALTAHIEHVYAPTRVEQLEERVRVLEELVAELLTDQCDDGWAA